MNISRILLYTIPVLFYFTSQAQQSFDHALWDQVLSINVSANGKVNYDGVIENSSTLHKYLTQLSHHPPTEKWHKKEKMAYWINAYNAYTIKLIIDNYPIKSIKDIHSPWKKKFFKINEVYYSLNDLEHTILRKFEDPRIHFAINCASFSCPIVWNKAFTSDNIEEVLDTLTKKFINDPQRNKITDDTISISKIFLWYKKDFKVNGGDVTTFINKYAATKIEKKAKKKYMDYDWSLNK